MIAGDQFEGSISAGEQPLFDIDEISVNSTLFSRRILESETDTGTMMAAGSCTLNQDGCVLFMATELLESNPPIVVGAATAGKARGVMTRYTRGVPTTWRS